MPRPLQISRPQVKRRDSESQLQSLVARVQCGDWPPVISSLLRDRLKGAESEAKEVGLEAGLLPRSIYRETLFLNMTVSAGHVDIGIVTRTLYQTVGQAFSVGTLYPIL